MLEILNNSGVVRPDNSLHSSVAGSNFRFEKIKKQLFLLAIIRFSTNLFRRSYIEAKKFLADLQNKLFVFKSQSNDVFFYVLCDADKKSEISSSSTAEVGHCGRILYSSVNEDPPEALWDVIEKGYFEPTGERGFESRSRGIEIARSGDIQKVRDFLKEVSDVNLTDEDSWTMLHHAAHCGDLNMIRLLRDMNANTQVRDNICGRKPIHIAAREGHARAVELFLIDKDSVNDTDKSGWTPLHYSAWKGESNTVEYLISKDADTEIMDKCLGKKPIHVAVAEGHIHIVQIFLDKGANINDVDVEGRTLLFHAALVGQFDMVMFLIIGGANIKIADSSGSKPIHASSICDHAQTTELFLSHGSDIESRTSCGQTPLHCAACFGGIKGLQILLEKGANVIAANENGETPFDKAVEKQHLETASYLAERMCEMFQDKAKYSDSLEIYKKLFKIQKETLGLDHHKTLATQSNTALMLYELSRYEEALETLNVILSKRQDILGPYHFGTMCTKYEKGRVYVAQWELDEAMEIFKEVFKVWQDTLGAGHHRTLSVARELAFVHFKKCEFEEALKIFEDVYEKRKLSSGVNDPVTLQALEDVAIVLVNKGENENALRILKDVFAKRKECLGAHHPETLFTGSHIATVQKRLESATKGGRCCLQ